jgi:hypothetical protein
VSIAVSLPRSEWGLRHFRFPICFTRNSLAPGCRIRLLHAAGDWQPLRPFPSSSQPCRGSHVRRGLRCGSYPLARSLPKREPHRRTFPVQDTRSTQEHAFANRFSRDWRLLKKDKNRLRGHPNDQQESRSSHCKHYERPKMMSVRLPAQWAFFYHGLAAGDPLAGEHRRRPPGSQRAATAGIVRSFRG